MTLTDLAVRTLTSPPIAGIMAPLRNACVPVFMLHRARDPELGVRGTDPKCIEQALAYLKKQGYQGISIHDLLEALKDGKKLPKNAIAFTIDDGFKDQAEVILPIFEKHQIPITMFLATDLLDSKSWSWDFKLDYITQKTTKQSISIQIIKKEFSASFDGLHSRRNFVRLLRNHLKSVSVDTAETAITDLASKLDVAIPTLPPKSYSTMDWEMAKRLESKFISFGPHSCRHVVLSQLSESDAKLEIEASWKLVKTILDNPVPVFCYPTGRFGLDFNERDIELVKEAGLEAAFSSDPGYVLKTDSASNLFNLKRFSFPDSMIHFRQYCSWLERAKELTRIHR